MPLTLLLGALAIGVVALLADGLGTSSQDVLFSGRASIPPGRRGLGADRDRPAGGEALAYAVCLGCGFRGGPVFPAIFLGVAVAMLAAIAFDMSPTLALAVGTAAGMTAMTRLILASLIIAALLVGTAGVEAIPWPAGGRRRLVDDGRDRRAFPSLPRRIPTLGPW